MQTITKAQPGEVLHVGPKNLTIMVVMAGDDGIRYIDPMNLEFDNNGNITTEYISYAALSDWTISFGTVVNISAALMGKQVNKS